MTEVAEKEVSAAKKLVKGVKKVTKAGQTAAQETPEVSEAQSAEVKQETVGDVVEKQEAVAMPDSKDAVVSMVHNIENLTSEKALGAVAKLLDNIDHEYFHLGGVLSVIQSNGYYQDKGYETFRSLVEAEYGLQYRKAMYLVSIYNGLVSSGVSFEKVKKLGWTKLKELATILTPENVDEWVGIASSMTLLQLQEYISQQSKGVKAGGDTAVEPTKVTTMTFKLHEDQKTTIREALEKAKHESGTEFDAVALEMICIDYLSGSKLKQVPTLKEALSGKTIEDVVEVLSECFPDLDMTISEK